MKKIIFLLLTTIPVLAGYAQKSKANSALYYLKDYNSTKDTVSLRKAKENIDQASEHIDTKDKAALHILRMLTSPMALMSRPAREEIEKLATQYVATVFECLGLEPAGDKRTFFQEFDLATRMQSKLSSRGAARVS